MITPVIYFLKYDMMSNNSTVKVEYKLLNDTNLNVLSALNDIIDFFKTKFDRISIGIAENDPEDVLRSFREWNNLTVIYKIRTLYMLNIIEFWMIDEHWKIYADKNITEEFDLTFKKEKYLYILSC